MIRTPWFPPGIKPVREGVYEIQIEVLEDRLGGYGIQRGFCYFGCTGWCRIQSTVEDAHKSNLIRGSQMKMWRGIRK